MAEEKKDSDNESFGNEPEDEFSTSSYTDSTDSTDDEYTIDTDAAYTTADEYTPDDVEDDEEEDDFIEDEELEEEEEEKKKSNTTQVVLLVLFIVLFLLSTAMVFYYQFYGWGEDRAFEWSMKHRADQEMADAGKDKSGNGAAGETVSELEKEIEELKQANDELTNELAAKTKMLNSPASSESNVDYSSGTFFFVQIGAFTQFDMREYFKEKRDMQGMAEVVSDGYRKYVLGPFTDFQTAKNFRDDMRKVVKKAWVVKTTDGKRIPIDPETGAEK